MAALRVGGPQVVEPGRKNPASQEQKFAFVIASGPDDNDKIKSQQTFVRSYVMRNLRRNQRALDAQSESGGTLNTSLSPRRMQGKFKVDVAKAHVSKRAKAGSGGGVSDIPETRRELVKSSSPRRPRVGYREEDATRESLLSTWVFDQGPARPINPSSLDPFKQLPLSLKVEDERLLHSYFKAAMFCWCPTNPGTSWARHALTEPALMYATLFHWTARVLKYVPDNRPYLPDKLELYARTLGHIKENMAKESSMISDGNIAAVACLADYETWWSDEIRPSMHVEGLNRMIELRGGIHTLGIDGLLQRMIYWGDAGRAMAMQTTLAYTRYQPSDFSSEVREKWLSRPMDDELARLSKGKRDPFNQGAMHSLSLKMRQFFLEVRMLSDRYVPGYKAEEGEKSYICDVSSITERAFISVISAHEPIGAIQDDNSMICVCLCLGAMVYLLRKVRLMPVAVHTFVRLTDRLKYALELVKDSETAWQTIPEFRIWILTSGLIGALTSNNKSWYANQLASACRPSQIESWKSLRSILRQVCWLDDMNPTFEPELWNEVISAANAAT